MGRQADFNFDARPNLPGAALANSTVRITAPVSRPLAVYTTASLLDHLVGAREQRRRKFEAERLGGFKVYNQFELSGLFERQVRRACAAQNARHEIPYARANRNLVRAI
jgi:hypothetical protein